MDSNRPDGHKPASKRRKLSRGTAMAASSSKATETAADTLPQAMHAADPTVSQHAFQFFVANPISQARSPAASLACTSCHRALNGISRTSQAVLCSRCNAASCSICSRVCSSGLPSIPPTPALSYSPTPPGTPLAPSPHRAALALQNSNTFTFPNAHFTANATSARRRKTREDDDSDGDDGDSLHKGAKSGEGCGRTVCKECSVEIQQSRTVTCYDCYGLPPPLPSVQEMNFMT